MVLYLNPTAETDLSLHNLGFLLLAYCIFAASTVVRRDFCKKKKRKAGRVSILRMSPTLRQEQTQVEN